MACRCSSLSPSMCDSKWFLNAFLGVLIMLAGQCYGRPNLHEGWPCSRPDGSTGTCLKVRHCPPLLALQLQPRPLSADRLKFLREVQCGKQKHHPLVCCALDEQDTTATEPSVSEERPWAEDVSAHPNLGLVNDDSCGLAYSSRIVNGDRAGLFEFPWMAHLAYKTLSGEIVLRCGGTIINENYILTAAHCITYTIILQLVGVRVGDHDTSTARDCLDDDADSCAAPPQDIEVAFTLRHPDYDKTTLDNDVALIRLAAPIRMNNDSVLPICLPVGRDEQDKRHEEDDAAGLVVAGWGATELGPPSPVLRKTEVPFVGGPACEAKYRDKALRRRVDHRQMCAGGGPNSRDSCLGDSGGPLMGFGSVGDDPFPRYVQYGVVSFGHVFCGTPGVPAVYARLGWYMPWLLDNIRP